MQDHREIALEAPLGRALWTLGWPIGLANELYAFSAFLLAFWIGHLLGKPGLAVDTLFRPVGFLGQMIVNAASLGGSVLVARSVGAVDRRGAGIVVNAMTLTFAIWAGLAIIVTPIAGQLAGLIAGDATLDRFMTPYLLAWLFAALPAAGMAEVLGDVIGATGWTRLAMIRTLLDLVAIAALLPVLIRVLDFGIAGAQLCIGIGGTVLVLTLVHVLRRRGNELGLGEIPPRALRPDWATWREILKIGLPVQGSRMYNLGIMVVMTQIIAKDGQAAVAGYGAAMMLFLIIAEFTNALGQAGRTIIGQSIGAGDFERARRVLPFALKLAMAWTAAAVAFLFIGEPLIAILTSDPEVKVAGARALRILSWGLFGIAICHVVLNTLAAYKKTGRASVVVMVSDTIGMVCALLWPTDSWLDAGCYGLLVANLLKAAILAALGFHLLRNIAKSGQAE